MSRLQASALLAYARKRLREYCLDDAEHLPLLARVSVFHEVSGKYVEMPESHCHYQAQAVTIHDVNSWFECRTKAEVDSAVKLFVDTYAFRDNARKAAA